MERKSFLSIGLILLFVNASSVKAQISTEGYVPCQEIPYLMKQFEADEAAIYRFYSPSENAPRYRMAKGLGSPDRQARLRVLNEQYLNQLKNVNFDRLPQECKVDYLLFTRDLKEKQNQLEKLTQQMEQLKGLFPFADSIFTLERSRRRGNSLDAARVASTFSHIAKVIPLLMKNLGGMHLEPEQIRAAGEEADLLRRTAASIFQFYDGFDPAFSWWVPEAYHRADSMLVRYAGVFQKKQQPNKMGIYTRTPIGREELMRLLQHEFINYSPDELLAIAHREMAWCQEEMLKASAALGFGNDWKAALEKVKASAVPVGQQPAVIRKLYDESVDFLKKNDLITIPELAEETWGMIMMSPERQKSNAFFTGGWEISITYPTNTMDFGLARMRMLGNNPYFSRATVHHELIAGHNLEFFMNARYRTYRNFDTPFWMEGWALYWEMLLWDKGFARTPEERIGMLFWRKYRCARIIFQLNFHLGKWSAEQCADFLVDEVGHERANVESELNWPLSRDSQAFPLYQVSYYIGGLQFYALQREVLKSHKYTLKEFHDTVLKLNAMPVEMIRAILLEKPLTRESKTVWKFYQH
ncbi:DUF885 family protein [Olivibacter jilunii]|uniref:DUF885 family protein n=1 Tax=Olivibacter jilunii TaxID=985016 RepID=UPI003F1753B1